MNTVANALALRVALVLQRCCKVGVRVRVRVRVEATASAQFVAHRIFVDTGMMACPHDACTHTVAHDIM